MPLRRKKNPGLLNPRTSERISGAHLYLADRIRETRVRLHERAARSLASNKSLVFEKWLEAQATRGRKFTYTQKRELWRRFTHTPAFLRASVASTSLKSQPRQIVINEMRYDWNTRKWVPAGGRQNKK